MMLFMAVDSGGLDHVHYAGQPPWFPLRLGRSIRDDGRSVMDDWLALNLANWNEWMPVHLAAGWDDLAPLQDGHCQLDALRGTGLRLDQPGEHSRIT